MAVDMLSIGHMAHVTGVSRRMLRHWEEVGLLAPASVDEFTGYRRYARNQVGRVRAIASLRAVGFSLDAIGDLLGGQLSERRLQELLRAREDELVARIDEDSARLTEVRKRLTALQRGHRTIMKNLKLDALPALRLAALQAVVGDESEIGDAVADLLSRVRDQLAKNGVTDVEVVLTYDGTSEDSIVVTAGAPTSDAQVPGLEVVRVEGADRGAIVRFDTPPVDIGDAWIAIDANLEQSGQETTGVYRQTLTRDGGVVLQAPLKDLPHAG
ncbi:MerR family transcriptional regulator [Serinicoccus sp. CUA-874]|uniref:MerR family transcriptional regulator n=1 Tax=Serinicoccus sp. CUA-874 TaxID=1517939 RepID=UPI0009638FD9|nr:MerR family transcriptional regulator [Serinicoccus sp. CUA-874]OLT18048.1 MerR family transcriptional regulator [Serinicoccus sp. CUA-874]